MGNIIKANKNIKLFATNTTFIITFVRIYYIERIYEYNNIRN